MASLAAAAPLLLGMVLPAPLKQSSATPTPVFTGGDTANILFGKMQRHATLPGSRLSPTPLAAVDNQGRLNKVLWSQFMMSSVPSSDILERADLGRTRRMQESLLIIDCTAPEAGGGGGLPNPFAKLFGGEAPAPLGDGIDPELLSLAAARGAQHVYVLLDGSGAEAALQRCIDLLAPLDLCATLIAPEEGVTLQTTKDWVCKQLQDHEGEVATPLAVRSGVEQPAEEELEEGEVPMEPAAPPTLLPPPADAAGAGGSLPREDFAELTLQCVLRCARTAEEGAPKLRVLRVRPAEEGELTERPVVCYEANFGPKTRARLGNAQSAEWGALLAPFVVIRKSDPEDWRRLIETDPELVAPPGTEAALKLLG